MRMKKTKGMLYFDNIYILGKILKNKLLNNRKLVKYEKINSYFINFFIYNIK